MRVEILLVVHKIALDPTDEQRVLFAKCAGVARFSYNWALAEWQRQRKAGLKPREGDLRKQLNAIKRDQFPWMREVSKNVPQQAIKNVGKAYSRAFDNVRKKRRRGRKNPYGFPQFKKKGQRDSFRADNGSSVKDGVHTSSVEVVGQTVKLSKIGKVRMCEPLRYGGVIMAVTVSREADRWFASFQIECPAEWRKTDSDNVVGVDLGVKDMAITSDGRTFEAPKALKQNLRRLKRASKRLSRRKKGSRNRLKAKAKIARLHRRISNIRKDALHKATTAIVRSAGTIVLEDLNVSGMLANKRLSRAIADIGLFEFRRQITYKAERHGVDVVIADRWFPSSKTCSACGSIRDELPLHIRHWTCDDCGEEHDRDLNAAKNLERLATGKPPGRNACGADGSALPELPAWQPAVLNQETGSVSAGPIIVNAN